MEQLSFLTPVYDPNQSCIQRFAEEYFYFGNHEAHVRAIGTSGEELVMLRAGGQEWAKTIVKVITYLTVLLPLIVLVVKLTYRLSHNYVVVTNAELAKIEMERDFVITEAAIADIIEIITKLTKPGKFKMPSGNDIGGFFLASDPTKVVYLYSSIDKWKKVWGVVTEDRLSSIVLPKAQEVEVRIPENGGAIRKVVVEENRPILEEVPAIVALESHWQSLDLSPSAVRDLTTLIAKTGVFVDPRFCAVLPSAERYSPTRIAISTLSPIDESKKKENLKSFMHMVSASNIDVIAEEAARHGIEISADFIKESKLALVKQSRLTQFHTNKGITGKEPINLETAPLRFNEQYSADELIDNQFASQRSWTLQEKAQEVVGFINRLIQESSSELPLNHQRRIYLELVGSTVFQGLSTLSSIQRRGLVRSLVGGNSALAGAHEFVQSHPLSAALIGDAFRERNNDAQNRGTWLERILDELKDKNHIFDWKPDYSGDNPNSLLGITVLA